MAGLLSGYETTFITRIDMTEDALKALKDKIEGVIKASGAELVYQEDWGKRRLAYPIQKETRGQYTHYVYTGEKGLVAEIERNLRLQEPVLRFLTIQIGKEFDKEKYMAATVNGTALKREERGEKTERPSVGERDRGDRGDRGGKYDDKYGDKYGDTYNAKAKADLNAEHGNN